MLIEGNAYNARWTSEKSAIISDIGLSLRTISISRPSSKSPNYVSTQRQTWWTYPTWRLEFVKSALQLCKHKAIFGVIPISTNNNLGTCTKWSLKIDMIVSDCNCKNWRIAVKYDETIQLMNFYNYDHLQLYLNNCM